ncbi:MAG TPA: hypothetical protein VLJ76_08110 [Gaiellaceae bacterium]|nr:hypothetical protein [Gaiellaceae bacterium]
MGYNLWLSEDVAYTLGHRMGSQADAADDARSDEPARLTAVEAERIDLLMVEVAHRLETTRPAA